MNTLGAVFNLVFGCRHRQMSRVFTIDRRTYRVCCNCGKKFDYSLEHMSMRRARLKSRRDRARTANPNVVGAQ